MKKLAVVIVNYNVAHFLEQALLSVRQASQSISTEVWVVDNNSVDGSVPMVRQKFPEVRLIANRQNLGFSKANNQAIRQSNAEYVLLLNPDTIVREDTFEKALHFLDQHPEAGACGVRMVDGAGRYLPESKRGLPTPTVSLFKMSGLARLFPRSKTFARYYLGHRSPKETQEVEVLSGACMFLRKSVLDQVGLLEEEYFMYGEDIDLSYRILQAGYKNYYLANTTIVHFKGESTKKASINHIRAFYRAMIIFARTHFRRKGGAWLIALIQIGIYLKAGLTLLQRSLRQMALPLFDAGLIYLGLFAQMNFWEETFKREPTDFPPAFMQVVVPVYILIWLSSLFFLGGYDRPHRLWNLLRGSIVGTILVSALTNFTDTYRYSKALILLGGGWTFLVALLTRLVVNYLREGHFRLSRQQPKKIVVVGSPEEYERSLRLLREAQIPCQVSGFLTWEEDQSPPHSDYLGPISTLEEVQRIHQPEELIFCASQQSAMHLIDWMMRIGDRIPELKILPQDSDYIIGSHSRYLRGEMYAVHINLPLFQTGHLRNKRLLDLGLALLFLLLFPLFLPFVRQKIGFLQNAWAVLLGRKSWVGLHSPQQTHRRLKKGVLSPQDNPKRPTTNPLENDQFYAKHYHPLRDLQLIFRAFRELGRPSPP